MLEGICQVEEDLVSPADGEVWGGAGVEKQEAIPATEVNFKHKQFGTWVHMAVALDHGDDIV